MQTRLAVAFFVPALVYLAGAIGTQSMTIAVRGLSLSRLTLAELARGELITGMLIGLILAALAYPVIVFALGDVRLATAVCFALIVASALSTTIGLLLPWALWRLNIDPGLWQRPAGDDPPGSRQPGRLFRQYRRAPVVRKSSRRGPAVPTVRRGPPVPCGRKRTAAESGRRWHRPGGRVHTQSSCPPAGTRNASPHAPRSPRR